MIEQLHISLIQVKDRVRHDLGDIDELCNSIKEVGLIQPIVITRDNLLVAGERRLRALQRLSIKELIHAKQYIYNDETDEVRLKAIECEENLRRKNFTWQEEILAKKRLLELMQSIHGVARPGYPSRSDSLGITSPGFGINKLASLLGESNAQTSKDIDLANLIEAVPELAKADTKEAARRQAILGTAVAVALAQGAAKSAASPQPLNAKRWTLWEGDFVNNVNNIDSETVDLILVDPPYGEGTQGMAANSKTLLAGGFQDERGAFELLVTPMLEHSYRVLRADRFACFFFGFTFYTSLVEKARLAGFEVDVTPLVWVKNTVINTSPYTRYGRSYEPILLCRKGQPKLMRPSQSDVIQIQNVITRSTNETKFYHAQKPVALIEKLILDLSPPGPDTTVVDFCAGSGTTGIAALQQKRRVILFEKDLGVCNLIKARLNAL
jgi:ParB family transcriptional regulator, chromosome partitioning protein